MDSLTKDLIQQYALHRGQLDIPMPTDALPDGTMGPAVNQPPVNDKFVEHVLRQLLARRLHQLQRYGIPHNGAMLHSNPYVPEPELLDGVYWR